MTNQILLLFAEDEPMITLNVEEALEGGGYSVLTASSGHDAMAVLDQHGSELAGVITDIRLGDGPTGWDVARHARELKADVPVIYATADSADDWPIHGVPRSVIVQKPYAPAQLLTAISTLITEADTNKAG